MATAPTHSTAAGVWIYTLDNNNAAVQALNGAATLTDNFTALTVDGTAQLVTVTIAAPTTPPAITGDIDRQCGRGRRGGQRHRRARRWRPAI